MQASTGGMQCVHLRFVTAAVQSVHRVWPQGHIVAVAIRSAELLSSGACWGNRVWFAGRGN